MPPDSYGPQQAEPSIWLALADDDAGLRVATLPLASSNPANRAAPSSLASRAMASLARKPRPDRPNEPALSLAHMAERT